jgi:hypothetical protein
MANELYPALAQNNSSSPSRKFATVTPHDTNELATISKALWVGTTGDITVIGADDDTAVVFKGVSGLLPVRVRIVKLTGTTATDIVALF